MKTEWLKLTFFPSGYIWTPLFHLKSLTEGLVENVSSPQSDLHSQCRTTHWSRQNIIRQTDSNVFTASGSMIHSRMTVLNRLLCWCLSSPFQCWGCTAHIGWYFTSNCQVILELLSPNTVPSVLLHSCCQGKAGPRQLSANTPQIGNWSCKACDRTEPAGSL